MSQNKKLTYIIIAATALLHDGKRYEQGTEIELTEQEAVNLSLYVELSPAEQARIAAEAQAADEAAKKAAEAARKKEESERKKAEEAARKAAEAAKDADKA